MPSLRFLPSSFSIVLASMWFCAPSDLQAQQQNTTPEETSLAAAKTESDTYILPQWEIGVSGVALTRTAYPGSDTYFSRAVLLPYVIYRGDHLRVERGSSGYRAIRTPSYEFDIGFSGALGASSDKVQARRGMETIGHMIEFGPRFNWNITDRRQNGRWRLEMPLRAVFDVSHQFRGRGYSFEPELQYDRALTSKWRYSTGLSSVFGSDKLADTFYQVRPEQALVDRPAYDAKAGLLAWRLYASTSYFPNRDLRLFANLRIESVVGAANQTSSLVRRKTAPSAFIGFSYSFMQSERKATD